MVTGTQINVKSLALKLLSSLALLPRTKVCHFCCCRCCQRTTASKNKNEIGLHSSNPLDDSILTLILFSNGENDLELSDSLKIL